MARAAIRVVPLGRKSYAPLFLGDQTGWFYALRGDHGKYGRRGRRSTKQSWPTASPVAGKDLVYVPVSSWEENRPISSAYPYVPSAAERWPIVLWRWDLRLEDVHDSRQAGDHQQE